MKKFFPLCLLLIVAIVWSASFAGNIDRTPTVSNDLSHKGEKAPAIDKVKAVEVEADEMTPEKAARIAEDEASRPVYNLSNSSDEVVNDVEAIEEALANQKDRDDSQPVFQPTQEAIDNRRLIDIKADGIVTEVEKAEANEIFARDGYVSDFPPVVMNQVAEVEPNDSCLTAQPIACGDTVMCATLDFAGGDTNDWYTFTLDNTYALWDVTIETHRIAAGECAVPDTVDINDTYLELWGVPCDSLIAFDDDGSPDGWFSLINTSLPPGTYAINSDATHWGGQTGSYHLSLSCVDGTPTGCPGDSITIDLQTDTWGSEASWELMYAGTSTVVASGSGYSSNSSYTEIVCTELDSCYDFYIYDSYGDGGTAWQVYFNGVLSCSGTFPTGSVETCYGIGANCAPPVGMCCYNYPAVLCVDTTETECLNMGGLWDATKSCAVDTCALEGEFCENAIQIPGDPIGYSDTRSSVPYSNDYEWGGKDVVYTFTVTTQSNLKFSLCNSTMQWRSVLWLYDDLNCGGAQLAYSSYSSSPCGTMAELDYNCAPGTYYLIVDGSSTPPNEGDYTLDISLIPPCIVDCPINAIPEGEAVCDTGYIDTFNGGCNSDPAVFSTIACGDTICGETGTFVDTLGGNSRDTDWYQFTLTEPKVLTATGVAEVPLLMFLIDAGSGDCIDYTILVSGTAAECDTLTISAGVQPAGDYWLWVGPSVFTGYPCGSKYWATLDCAVPPPPPANDSCSAAIPVAVPSSTPGTTANATVDDTFPTCGTSITAPGVWYSVTGTGNTMTANTCDSTYYDTKMSVYCGSCLAPICVGGNDDMTGCSYSSLVSEVTWCSQAGQEYFILVHGFSSNEGDFVLNVLDDGVPCSTPVECVPPTGRCCYNNDIDCVDNTAPECAALGGNWDATKTCANDPCICPEDEVVIEYTTDTWPSETSWELTNDATGDTVAMVAEGDYVDPNTLYTHNICVDSAACYTFSVHDAWGDGGGPYVIMLNGDTVATGDGNYGLGEDVYGIGNGCAPLTGACCVDDNCVATNTEPECAALGGTWHVLEDCATFACPITPANCDTNVVYSNGLPLDDYGSPASQCAPDYPFAAGAVDDILLSSDTDVAGLITWTTHWNGNVGGPASYSGVNITFYYDDLVTPGQPAGEPIDTCAHSETSPGGIYFTKFVDIANIYYILADTGCSSDKYRMEVPLDTTITLAANTLYWLEIQPVLPFQGGGQSAIVLSDANTGAAAMQIFALAGIPTWTTISGSAGVCQPDTGGFTDLAFCLLGPPPPAGCDYTVGDVNGSNSYNGLDITYGVAFFKGGPEPACPNGSCPIPPCDSFFYCGDVNGSCSYNGLDITYGVSFFKGGAAPVPCPSCPPVGGPMGGIHDQEAPSVIKTKPMFDQKPSLK